MFGLRKTLSSLFSRQKIDEDWYESLEETLLLGDVGMNATQKLIKQLRSEAKLQKAETVDDLKNILATLVKTSLSKLERPHNPLVNLPKDPNCPQIWLIVGVNGAGKTTLLKTILSKRFDGIAADSGDVKWAENANVGVMPQDNTELFAKEETLMEWMSNWRNTGDHDQVVRGTLGRLLFSGDDIGKDVKVLSGGEKGRMIWGKLMLQKHNVLAMDEPTNHMDMESIESLQIALEKFEGTLIFVSHDREFVQALANRILEVKMDGTVEDYSGTYEEYLRSQALAG